MVTNTPDEHVILDQHPVSPQVAIASPGSGHGCKLCSVAGDIPVDLAAGFRWRQIQPKCR